ncbi:MAG: phospholipase [Bacteroidales bacterium]|nr:phospholipase [Bacteroidales bacterium]
MIAALIILAALVVVGGLLYIHHQYTLRHESSQEASSAETTSDDRQAATPAEEDSQCCGMHITCEKDSLLAAVSPTKEYYDDEELDRFRGTDADAYSDEAIEEFRNVLLTLLPTDIAGWARSLQLRGITLPTEVREELLLIVSEARAHA